MKLASFVQMLKLGGVINELYGHGPYTVFAPYNDAFGKLHPESLNLLLDDPVALCSCLNNHIFHGLYTLADLSKVESLRSIQGDEILVDTEHWEIGENSKIICSNKRASNGIIHVVDHVVQPIELLII